MKRTFFAFAVAAASSLSSHAIVTISWSSPAGSITQSDGTTAAPRTWYAQLIWSPDNVASPFNASNPFVVDPTEQVLREQALNPISATDGRVRGNPTSTDVADSFATGFLYTRVFNTDFVAPGVPTFFGQSAVTGNPTALEPGRGLTITTSDPTTANSHSPVVTVNQQIVAIPEPSTYALAAVGIAAALWRRRRKA